MDVNESMLSQIGRWAMTPSGVIVLGAILLIIYVGDKYSKQITRVLCASIKTIAIIIFFLGIPAWVYFLITSLISFNFFGFMITVITGVVGFGVMAIVVPALLTYQNTRP